MVKPKSEVYTATYSGIQVFEMSVGDCTMMRRRSDSYLNATQILKLGGLDKGKRTKILEREVISKTHEKIQGGYGKYQGTWVPLEIGRDLAERYEVLHLLLPLLDFDTSTWDELPEKEQMPPRVSRTRINYGQPSQRQSSPSLSYSSQQDSVSANTSFKRKSVPLDNEESDSTKIDASSSPLPIPLALPSGTSNTKKRPRIQAQPKQKQHTNATNNTKDCESNKGTTNGTINNSLLGSPARSTIIGKKDDGIDMDTEQNRSILVSIFTSEEDDTIPSYFYGTGATTGIDWDISIDEHGNTALHWSVSLGRMHTVEWLISKGAKVIMVNSAGETPLMRGVMTTFIYDHDCFPHMLDILRDSLSLVDYVGRNVLHHIILLTLESKTTAKSNATDARTPTLSSAPINLPSILESSPQLPPTTTSTQQENRLLAAKSYMTQVMKVITQHNEHIHILNQRDMSGETPYGLAHRLNCVDLCYLLVQSGYSLSSQESMSENSLPSFMALPPLGTEKQAEQLSKRPRKKVERKDRKEPTMDDLVNKTSTKSQELVSTVQRFVDSMDLEFNSKLQEKEADIARLQQEIRNLTQQLDDAHKLRTEPRKTDARQLEQAYSKIKHLENALGNAGIKDLEFATTSTESQLLLTTSDSERLPDREKHLEQQILHLQSQLTNTNNNAHDKETLAQNHAQALESLAGCKRLIAMCCNLPLEKVDDFIGPLTMAIENDPPDLDFARVIGFMEKLRNKQH